MNACLIPDFHVKINEFDTHQHIFEVFKFQLFEIHILEQELIFLNDPRILGDLLSSI